MTVTDHDLDADRSGGPPTAEPSQPSEPFEPSEPSPLAEPAGPQARAHPARGEAGGRGAWLRMGLAAELPSIGAARHTVGRFLELAAVGEEEAESLVLVTSELCTNAVEATPSPDDDELVVACRVVGQSVEVKVTNRGEPFAPDYQLPEPEADSGRGLYLVDSLTDRLVVRHRAGRTTVTATRHLTALPEPDHGVGAEGSGSGEGAGSAQAAG